VGDGYARPTAAPCAGPRLRRRIKGCPALRFHRPFVVKTCRYAAAATPGQGDRPCGFYMQGRSPRRSAQSSVRAQYLDREFPAVFAKPRPKSSLKCAPRPKTARREFEGVSRRPVDPSTTSHAAHELIERRTTTMHVANRELTAHVVKFWRGASVLEITVTGTALAARCSATGSS
jgi:hypothetical protein